MAEKKKPSPESVKAVQKLLKEQGFYKGDISGIKNWATVSAIREYQVKNKLANTGEIDDVSADLASKTALVKQSAQPSVKPAMPPSQAVDTTQGAAQYMEGNQPASAPPAPAAAQSYIVSGKGSREFRNRPPAPVPPPVPAAAAPAATQSGKKSGPVADILRRGGGGVQVPADAPGVADFMAGIRGIVKPEMDAAAAANQVALVDAARKEGFGQGEKWAQQAADQKKQEAAAGRNAPVFLSEAQLARYNNSVKWAEAGMSPRQIFDKHANTIYGQPDNVAADISKLPATFLEDNNFTLKPPAQKGAMGGMPAEGQWNKLFPNRAGRPDMPNAGARAPAKPLKPGAQLMGDVMAGWASGWEGAPNEHPDDLRARRADLFRQQMAADLAPGWHEPQTSDMIGSTFTQDGDTRSFTAPAFGGSDFATNVPKLPSAPPAVKQGSADAKKPPINPDPNAEVPDLSGLKLPK